jgi:hypothetical protein
MTMSFDRESTTEQATEPAERDTHATPGRANRAALLPAPAAPIPSGLIQREADDTPTEDNAHELVAQASASSGSALPDGVAQRFEASLGTDLSSVRVHTGGASAAAADAVGAKAYALGNDIHFADGQYDTSSHEGQHLLAHEVAHTVQQRGGAPVRQNQLSVSAPGDAAEHEADRAADAMIDGDDANVTTGVEGTLQLRPSGPAAPADVHATARAREISKLIPFGPAGNAVDQALKAFDWGGFDQFLHIADQTRTQYDLGSPQSDTDSDQVKQAQDRWKASLEAAYAQEEAEIAQILNSDPEIRGHVKEIESKGAAITEAHSKRNAELVSADGALDTLAGLRDAKEAEANKNEADKQEARKASMEASKAAALEEIANNAKLISGLLDFGHDAIKDGLPKAAGKVGTDAVKYAITAAYSEWASGPVTAEYNARIKSISAKIGTAKSNVKTLTSSALEKQITGAAKQFSAAMANVSAHNATAGRLKQEVNGHRAELEQTMKTKHANIALFSMTRTATEEMAPLVDNYRASLAANKATLEPLQVWPKWLSGLQSVKNAVSATDRLIGGDTDAAGQADLQDLEAHQRLPREDATRKKREQTARQLVQQYQSALGPSIAWLQSLGQWLDSELQFNDAELAKCLGGDHTAFIREIEGKVHALIEKKYM